MPIYRVILKTDGQQVYEYQQYVTSGNADLLI